MADPIANNSQAQNSSGFFQSLYDGIIKGDFSNNNSKTKIASQIGVGIVPGLGQVADARDTYAAIRDVSQGKPSAWNNLGFSLLGWVPLAGDFAKSANKIGLKKTINSISDSFSSIKDGWKELSMFSEKRLGHFDELFYHPETSLGKLPKGTFGITNRWGDIKINKNLYDFQKLSTFDHENVHRFFSPTFKYGQEFRSKLGLLGYTQSHLLKRTEEGLAEAWAKYKLHGFKGIKKGWNFPIKFKDSYDIDLNRLRIERNILLGVGSTTIGAGAAIGNSMNKNE